MNLERKKSIEFDWSESFDRELMRLLVEYRLTKQPETDFVSQSRWERRLAQELAQRLRTLMASHRPLVDSDSDIAALINSMHVAHDGAKAREEKRMGQ